MLQLFYTILTIFTGKVISLYFFSVRDIDLWFIGSLFAPWQLHPWYFPKVWIGNEKRGNCSCCYKCLQADLSQARKDNKLSVPIQDTEREHFVCSGINREKMTTRLQCRGWVTSQACQTYLWPYTVYTNKLEPFRHRMWRVQTDKDKLVRVLFLCHCLCSWDTLITLQHYVIWLAEGHTKG